MVGGAWGSAKGAVSGDGIDNEGPDRTAGEGTTGVGNGVGGSGGVGGVGGVGRVIGLAAVGVTSVGGVGSVIGLAAVGFLSIGEAVGWGKSVVSGGVTGGLSSRRGGGAGGNIP